MTQYNDRARWAEVADVSTQTPVESRAMSHLQFENSSLRERIKTLETKLEFIKENGVPGFFNQFRSRMQSSSEENWWATICVGLGITALVFLIVIPLVTMTIGGAYSTVRGAVPTGEYYINTSGTKACTVERFEWGLDPQGPCFDNAWEAIEYIKAQKGETHVTYTQRQEQTDVQATEELAGSECVVPFLCGASPGQEEGTEQEEVQTESPTE